MEHKTYKATLNELSELSIMFDEYRQFYGKKSDIEAAKSFLKARIERNESEVFYTKNKEGIMTGFVQLYPIFSSTRMRRMWLLNDLYVHKDFQGKGYSVALIERAKQLGKETNACSLFLETEKTNTIGNTLYTKMGFEQNTACNFYELAL